MKAAGVLSVLDDEIASLPIMAEWASSGGCHCDAIPAINRLTEARAAVAELIEALLLADAMLSGANMNAAVVQKKVRAAIAKATGEAP